MSIGDFWCSVYNHTPTIKNMIDVTISLDVGEKRKNETVGQWDLYLCMYKLYLSSSANHISNDGKLCQ